MYNSTIINQRIASILKTKPFNQKQLLERCGLNVNLLNKMTDNRGIGCFALAKIADSLETSTDYLLGRTDKPDMTITVNQTGEIIESSPINAVNNAGKASDEMTAELSEIKTILDSLSVRDRHDLLSIIFNYGDTHIKK